MRWAWTVVLCACGARSSLPDFEAADRGDDASTDGALDASADARADAQACIARNAEGGACNDLVATGAPIDVVCESSAPPVPSGGTIVDGTYVLTSMRFFGPCVRESDRITWSICGSAWSTVQEANVGTTTTRHIDGDVNVSGTNVAFAPTCGTPSPVVFGFDATPTTLTLYIHGFGPDAVRVDRFIRQ